MKPVSIIVLAAVAISVLSLGACGLDEYYTSIGEKAVPGQQLYLGGQTGVDPVVECTCNCQGGGTTTGFKGSSFVMDKLELGSPLASFKPIVNDFIAAEVGKGTINVLLSILEDDRAAGIMDVQFGVGSKAGASFSFNDGSAVVEASLNATSGAFVFTDGVERFVLTVPMEGSDPISIPIQRVIIGGTIAGGKITGGTLTGVVSMQDAESTIVAGFQLSSVLIDAEQAMPDYDMDNDGKMDAWVFNGTFTAKTCTIKVDDVEVADEGTVVEEVDSADVIEGDDIVDTAIEPGSFS